jgi:hypothetical protein
MWTKGFLHMIDTWIILTKLAIYMDILFCHLSITQFQNMLNTYDMSEK